MTAASVEQRWHRWARGGPDPNSLHDLSLLESRTQNIASVSRYRCLDVDRSRHENQLINREKWNAVGATTKVIYFSKVELEVDGDDYI